MIVSPASATHSPSGSSARQNPWNSGGRSGAVDASPCRTRKSLTACWTIRRAGSRSPPHGAAGDELELRLDLALVPQAPQPHSPGFNLPSVSGNRPDVLVHVEEVLGIVFRLDLLQPPIVRPIGGGDRVAAFIVVEIIHRSEEHTSEIQSLMRNSYAV